MSKIQTVIDAVTGKDHPDFTKPTARMDYFKTMPLGAQVVVAYRCAQSAHNSVIWYDQRIEEEEAREKPNMELIRNNNRERITSSRTLHSILSFLNHAANYVEADGQTVVFDQASVDIQTGAIDNDEVTGETNVAVKRAPHEWARRNLQNSGIWPEEFEANDEELVLFNMDRVCDRIASQYIARMVISLAQDGIYIPQPTDARDIIVIGLSPMIADLAKCKTRKSLEQAILRLAALNPPIINDVPYSREQIVAMFNQLIEDDAAETEKSNLNNEIKEINTTVKEAIRTHAIMGAVISGASEMKKAGLSDDLIKEITGQLSAKLAS